MILETDPDLTLIEEKVSRQARNFILKCLEKDKDERPTADDLLKDIWFNNVRVSSFQESAFNSAFTQIYSYSKVDNFTTAICSIVSKMLMEPEVEAELRRIFESADHDKTGTLDEIKLYNAMTEVGSELNFN